MLYLGIADIARFGVAAESLTGLFRVASLVSMARGEHFAWLMTAPNVTSTDAATARLLSAVDDANAVVLALGYEDAFLPTDPETWAANLRQVILAAQCDGHHTRGVILAGLPPLGQFRGIPWWNRARVRGHVATLNQRAEHLAHHTNHCIFVPFPDLRDTSVRLGDEEFSWAAIHQTWSKRIGTALLQVLPDQQRSHA